MKDAYFAVTTKGNLVHVKLTGDTLFKVTLMHTCIGDDGNTYFVGDQHLYQQENVARLLTPVPSAVAMDFLEIKRGGSNHDTI
jgi:hypothetical protein